MGGPRPPYFGPGRRRMNGEESPGQTPETGTPMPPVYGPRRRRTFENPAVTETETTPTPAPFGRRRERVAPVQPQEIIPPVPAVPPVQEKKAKPVRNDSLLEAIIKLVNSILTFKGK